MTKGVTLDLSSSPKRIILGLRAGATSANTTTYTIQELGSYIKEELKLSPLADDDQPFVWEGFNPLQGGNRVGIVFTLNTLWIIDADDFAGPGRHRIKLEQGIVLPEITDEEVLGTPANITWSLAEFTVSSLINQQDFENIKHKLASMSFGGQGGGHAYYWDPINGNDDNDGLSENAPTLSFSAAHTLAQNGGNDTIYLVYIGAGDLIITEQLVITKDTLSVIGPGFHTILDPGITGNTVDIVNADNVLIQGFQVKGDLSAGSNALNLH